MNNTLALSPQRQSALAVMAGKVNVEPEKLLATLKATVFQKSTNEELLALVVVANVYDLNPFLKEIYAFPNGKGGIVPMVPIDGWTKIVNRQEGFDGVEFEMEDGNDGKPHSCTATMYAKGRSHPIKVTEYFEECHRNTQPWNQMPRRMLRHKAYMQAARIAYGLSGIFDEDEARDAVRRADEAKPVVGDIQFGAALPAETVETPAATTEPEKTKRTRRTKAEMEAAKEPEPTEQQPSNNEPEPPATEEAPIDKLRRLVTEEGIDEKEFHRYLISNRFMEPADTFEKMSEERMAELIVSVPSIAEDFRKEKSEAA